MPISKTASVAGTVGLLISSSDARATTSSRVAKLQATIPVLHIRKCLVDRALLASKVVYLSEYQEPVGLQQDLVLQQSRLREADAAIALPKETKDRTAAEYRRARPIRPAIYQAKRNDQSAEGVADRVASISIPIRLSGKERHDYDLKIENE
ncbi:hypothetical protein LUI11_23015 [Bradyrhizobium diazoefficiens]|uniref:hypothetical protein n=1 Tax=Bradyrhizobium TaxID=374 RepID=UPI001E580FED|nr:hypothetical protein [Bradyrhizobium diazoefficiens]MCD9297778.1 hypothetical protein [Bradyrhizobium diazoefficiens]MCD9811612.1 hypothetical protein [Bradyrhizobium diazoefficiens]MCD9833256.1 hypothetical protein [Bradyrhizobium diazoefficiens]MCD9849188.1 hypothetical protein [Bradyrhizobium diazoefficiens]MCD9885645.1 hypothetical protein [Bradyrhizobium diazoefficiens]